jgi:hypothetical protein
MKLTKREALWVRAPSRAVFIESRFAAYARCSVDSRGCHPDGRKVEMRMLTVIPSHWFSWDFRLEDASGVPWGHAAVSAWRERGSVAVGDQQFRVSRDGLAGPFVVVGPNGESANAEKASMFKQEFRVHVGGEEYTLRRVSWWQREFALTRGGARVGTIAAVSWFSRRATAQLPDDMPAWACAFAVWLTVLMWKRDSDATATTASAG